MFAAPSHDDGLQRVPGSACCSDPPSAVAQRNSAHHCFSRMKHERGHACAPARGRSSLAAVAQTPRPDRQQISDPRIATKLARVMSTGLICWPSNLDSDSVRLLCFICRPLRGLISWYISDLISEQTREPWATSGMPCRTSCQLLWNDAI